MAILLVKIEDEKSLPLNEFFDYSGFCYASTGPRDHSADKVIDMADFYDADINTKILTDIPVVLVSVENDTAAVLGWYAKAEIFSDIHTLSFFLEGNIKAYTSDCVWLPDSGKKHTLGWFAKKKIYEVIEAEDARYPQLQQWIKGYSGGNQLRRYYTAVPHTIPKALQDITHCREACRQWAELVTKEECQDIRDLKTLEVYAKKLCEKDPKDSDGYYYLALACYHLGFVKEGLKQIGKALRLEPEASDLIALKGLLLVSRGYVEDGAAQLHQAWEISGYETYLLMEGRAYMIEGKADRAYDCFKQIGDENLLEEAGIRWKDMEKKWSSFRYGYMKLREMLKKK